MDPIFVFANTNVEVGLVLREFLPAAGGRPDWQS